MGIRPMDLKAAVLIASVVGFCTVLRTGRVHVADLDPGERVEIRYVTKGCFGSTRARITLTPAPGGALRYRTEARGLGVRAGMLDARDVARLDALVRAFREDRPGGCSTSRAMTVELHRGPWMLRREREWDGSCFDVIDDPDLLNIYDLFPLDPPAPSDGER